MSCSSSPRSSASLVGKWYVIPPPDKVRARGPYDPAKYLAAHGKQKSVYRALCATEPDAQPTNEIRLRHGLPEVPEAQIHRATKPRYDRWQRRDELAAAKRKQQEIEHSND